MQYTSALLVHLTALLGILILMGDIGNSESKKTLAYRML
jgi:hypothetical protein